MEVASALIDVATRVTVVTMDAVPFQLQLGEKLGRCLRQWHEARGVRYEKQKKPLKRCRLVLSFNWVVHYVNLVFDASPRLCVTGGSFEV